MRATTPALLLLLSFAACHSSEPVRDRTGGPLVLVPETDAPASKAEKGTGQDTEQDAKAKEAKEKAEKRAEELADKQKQLQQKQREIEYAKVEERTAGIEQQMRAMSLAAGMAKAKVELDKANTALELFRSVEKPKELEERLISHQYAVNNADQAKDELAELEAMYQAEEFAKATKELVIKRGRQRLELAQRSLAVSKTECDLLKEHTLPDKEQELVRKVADAEREVQKAELEGRKADLELELAARKARDHVQDLERDVAELQAKIEKLQQGGS